MTIEDIKNLKDKIYEIEGLLELAQLREDKIDELAPLIEERLKGLAGAADPTEATEATEAAVATEPAEVSEPMTIEELFEESQSISITHDMSPADSSDNTDNSDNSDNSDSIKSSDISAHPAAAHSAPRAGGASKPAFTLNDRFRFRRELFNNSDAEFSEAMGRIALMDSYDEAEEHFIDELGWDAENPEVADFMEIIRIYFEG